MLTQIMGFNVLNSLPRLNALTFLPHIKEERIKISSHSHSHSVWVFYRYIAVFLIKRTASRSSMIRKVDCFGVTKKVLYTVITESGLISSRSDGSSMGIGSSNCWSNRKLRFRNNDDAFHWFYCYQDSSSQTKSIACILPSHQITLMGNLQRPPFIKPNDVCLGLGDSVFIGSTRIIFV